GSQAAMKSPRVTRKRSCPRSLSPRARRRSVERESERPARKTKVGAQRWVIQRVANCSGSSGVPGVYARAESLITRPALKAPEAWSTVISTITRPRSASMPSRRGLAVGTGGGYRGPRMKRIDLSHPVVPGMETYPGLPVPEAHVLLDYDASRARYEGKA